MTLSSGSGCNGHTSEGMNSENSEWTGWNWSIHRCFYIGVQWSLMIAGYAQYWVESCLNPPWIVMWCCWELQHSVHLRSRKCCSGTEIHLPQKQSTWTYLHQKWTKKTWTDDWHKRRLTTKAINRIFSKFHLWGFFFPSRNLHELKTDHKTAANNRTKIFMISLHESYSAECFILQVAERKWTCAVLLLHRNMRKAEHEKNHYFHVKAKNWSVSGTTALHTCSVNVLTNYHFEKNLVGPSIRYDNAGSCIMQLWPQCHVLTVKKDEI